MNYTGVILAAGRGTRMQPLSERYPKPILPICNKPLIEYHIEALRDAGVRDIIVVVGHLSHHIGAVLGYGERLGVKITYVEQTAQLGIAHALGQLESRITGPFFVFLGDIYFQSLELAAMIEVMENTPAQAVLAVRADTPENIQRNFAVIQHDARVTHVIEKPRFPPNDLKGCGLYLFDQTIFDAIRRTPRTAARDEYEITEAIQTLANDHDVRISRAAQFDINITCPADLLSANMCELQARQRQYLIGTNCELPSENAMILDHAVIGNNVRMYDPVHVSHSVIFDNADWMGHINCWFDHCIVVGRQVITIPKESEWKDKES